MAQNDVGQFVRKHHGQGRFIRQNVDQAAADDNRVAHAESLQRRSQHHPRANWTGQIDIVGDCEIIDYRQQDLVHFARRSQQAGVLQTFNHVIFRLLLPLALRLQRGSIL